MDDVLVLESLEVRYRSGFSVGPVSARLGPGVYHLRGGILGYLETQGHTTQTWHGECFVFDKRASVDATLSPGITQVCWGCRMPLSPQDLESPHYEEGVCCARCHSEMTPEAKQSRRDRHRHMTTQKGMP